MQPADKKKGEIKQHKRFLSGLYSSGAGIVFIGVTIIAKTGITSTFGPTAVFFGVIVGIALFGAGAFRMVNSSQKESKDEQTTPPTGPQ